MPTRNINLTDSQDQFVARVLASGTCRNASEVVREGLRLLERREIEDAARLACLRGALTEAEDALASGDFEDLAAEDLAGWLDALRPDAR